MSLYRDIVEISKRYPDKIALSLSNEDITYYHLRIMIDALSCGLIEARFYSGERIGILLHNSYEFVVTLYALSRLGCVIALLSSQLSPAEIIYEYRRLQLSAMIIENYTYRKLLQIEPAVSQSIKLVLRSRGPDRIPYISQLEEIGRRVLSKSDLNSRPEEVTQDDNVLIQSSSGTTGRRKSAYRTYRNIDSDLNNIIGTFRYRSFDSFYCPVPLYHGYGLTMGLLAPLRCGASVFIDRWFMINRAAEILRIAPPTIFIGVPLIYESMIGSGSMEYLDFKSLRYCLCSGEALREETAFMFYEMYGVWINQIYGMMETSLISANMEVDKKNVLSVGRPARNVSICLDNNSTVTEGPAIEGEVLVRSKAVSSAYVSQNGSTDLPITGDWFSTGDYGYWDVSGEVLYITGRKGSHSED